MLGLPSLHETLEPAEARRIAVCLEIHYAPKHGSRLNLAEIEIFVRPGSAWRGAFPTASNSAPNLVRGRRSEIVSVKWRFETEDARVKLKSLNPSIQ